MYQDPCFPDPEGLCLSSKCAGLLPNPSAFSDIPPSRRANWELFQPHLCQLCTSAHAVTCFLGPSGDTNLKSGGTGMQVSLRLYNLQISLYIFLPRGTAACLMKSANLPAPQASLIRHLWYDKLLNNIIYFPWDIAREGYVSLPAETSSMMDETSGNIILAGCLSFNMKHTCVWVGPEFFSNPNSCKEILISFLWCN